MTHLSSILWLLTWPLTIYVSYLVISWILKKYDKPVADE